MASTNATPIVFFNDTGDNELEVIVFTKNFSKKTENQGYIAWQVLKGNSQTHHFSHSNQVLVSAEYRHSGLRVKAGPFEAKHGSTWKITHERRTDTALLEQGKEHLTCLEERVDVLKRIESVSTFKPNVDGAIIIIKRKSMVWDGYPFDIKIFRSGSLQLVYKLLHGGDQIDFVLPSKIYFGVVVNMNMGDNLKTLDDVKNMTEVDIFNYPRGVKVTAVKESFGNIEFTATPL